MAHNFKKIGDYYLPLEEQTFDFRYDTSFLDFVYWSRNAAKIEVTFDKEYTDEGWLEKVAVIFTSWELDE